MFRTITPLVFLLLAELLPGPVIFAKEKGGQSTTDAVTDSVMVMLQERSKGIKTCIARIETVVAFGGQRIEEQGIGYFKLPNLMRVETQLTDGIREISVSDGSYLWMYDASENAVTRVNLSGVFRATDLEADLVQFDPLRPFRGVVWESIRHVGVDTTGEAVQVFSAVPLRNLLTAQLPASIDHVELRVHTGDGLLRSARLNDDEQTVVIEQRFLDIQMDKEVEDRRFQFVVPAGAHPMDATSDLIQLLRVPD